MHGQNLYSDSVYNAICSYMAEKNENKSITQPYNSQESLKNMPSLDLDSYKDNPEQKKSVNTHPHNDGVEKATQNCPVQKWSVTGKGLTVAELGKKVTVSMALHPHEGQGATAGTLTACLVKRQECTITKMGDNQCEVSYVPKHCGQYELHIKEDGEHVSGSPYFVTVHRRFSTPTHVFEDISSPQGIDFLKDGRLVVVEYTEDRFAIIKNTFSEATRHYERYGSEGIGKSQFKLPCGVAVDDDDNILITDGRNDRIQKVTSQGKFIQAVGIQHPIGIGIHPQNKRVYVTEKTTGSVQILNPDLSPFKTFGSKGTGQGEFNDPKDVAFDSNGNVYVVDNENHRIQVFTADGAFLREFGQRCADDGTYERSFPSAICIDKNDIVYVTELYKCCVSLFTCDGKFLTSFGCQGNKRGMFNDPRGIAVDKDGVIYVSDHKNHRLQIF